jgi:hypothetical protein
LEESQPVARRNRADRKVPRGLREREEQSRRGKSFPSAVLIAMDEADGEVDAYGGVEQVRVSR